MRKNFQKNSNKCLHFQNICAIMVLQNIICKGFALAEVLINTTKRGKIYEAHYPYTAKNL